ncbi:MAG TPA: NAD(P)/FAD-dependent oxidoreductase [Acetobacteraceae bacterium]|nr:NAD(P)/FAD-dependent oxidoreductase [Acetobacteraceae bacterium]
MNAPSSIKPHYQLAVIGGGPAGLAAASTADRLGVDTVLLDEQWAPGGQIYRAITETPVRDQAVLGADYWRGADLVAGFRASKAQYVPGATVWSVSHGNEIGVSVAGVAQLFCADRVILATGAMERPFPIPGWTLPGVMTAGAAQILLKSCGMVAAGRVVLAGTGPLLWLIAAQYARAGAPVAALLDTTPRENWRAALTQLPAFLTSAYLRAGVALRREVGRRVPVIRDVRSLRVLGEDRAQAVAYQSGHAAERCIEADIVLLHQGVVPNLNLANAIGCRQVWQDTLLCFVPEVDAWGASNVEGVAIAGDGAGIGGAGIAAEHGRLAALDAAWRLGCIDAARRDAEAAACRQAVQRFAKGRDFLDRLHRPRQEHRVPTGDTLVCRCEEVTAQQILDTVGLGCQGPNQMKSFLRCGMGPCQGRLCGLTVTELIARARGVTPAQVGYYRLRPPIKPITLAELASLPKTEAAVNAVVRI